MLVIHLNMNIPTFPPPPPEHPQEQDLRQSFGQLLEEQVVKNFFPESGLPMELPRTHDTGNRRMRNQESGEQSPSIPLL